MPKTPEELGPPTLFDAIVWIGENDEPSLGRANFADIEQQLTTVLVADLFGVSCRAVAEGILNYRESSR